ncbi:BRCA2, helical, partial [Musa troglodytarum]
DVGEIAKASQTKASSLPNQAEMFSAHVSSKILVLQKWINENHVDNSSFSVCTESQALEIGSVNFDDVSLHLECWEEFLFKFNEMKRTREVRRGRNGSHPVSETIARWREHNRQLDCSIDGEKRIQNLRQSDQSKVACEAKEDRKTTVADIAVPHQSAWSCDEGFERVYHNLASFRAVGASVSSANQIKFLITKLKDEVHSDHMNVSGSRESIIEFPTVELEDEGGRNEKPSVVADACNVELYQYMPEESPNLLQCGRNNHDGYEKSVLRNPSSTEKALSIIDGSNPKTGSSKPSTIESNCCGRISTRYPFQLKRKNLKDFFGGPPTFQDLSGSLPHEVSNMDADNAVTYRFYDASHHDEIGLETFQVMLLKSGASSSNATKEWVANHYR